MATQTSPAAATTAGVGDQLKSLFFDTARYKLIDVEHKNDSNNIPDSVDVRTGVAGAASKDAQGGMFSAVRGAVTSHPALIALGLGGLIGLVWWAVRH